ncbi:MAG: hypothetical protein ACI4NU_06810 [Christensenellales bacterium]
MAGFTIGRRFLTPPFACLQLLRGMGGIFLFELSGKAAWDKIKVNPENKTAHHRADRILGGQLS